MLEEEARLRIVMIRDTIWSTMLSTSVVEAVLKTRKKPTLRLRRQYLPFLVYPLSQVMQKVSVFLQVTQGEVQATHEP